MDWFERLTGFREISYDDTRARLAVEGNRLRSLVNGRSYGIGELELVSLAALRGREAATAPPGRLKVSLVSGDVRRMHGQAGNARALFQVASQFNLLETASYDITPEDGVTRYEQDHTQGPACAIAAGAATVYRNYFAPVGGGCGQTRGRQFDALADLGNALSAALAQPVDALWKMRNGYALCTQRGLEAIGKHLSCLGPDDRDRLRGFLRIGIHRDVEVTDAGDTDGAQRQHLLNDRQTVSQAFCSALPVAYTRVTPSVWKTFATLVLEAAYEATLWAAAHNARRGASDVVLLTCLGGGAFGNDESWILHAMGRALKMASDIALDVRIVSYGAPSAALLQLVKTSG